MRIIKKLRKANQNQMNQNNNNLSINLDYTDIQGKSDKRYERDMFDFLYWLNYNYLYINSYK